MSAQTTKAQKVAIKALLAVFCDDGGYLVEDLGPALSCTEANALAQFFRAFGEETTAALLIQSHAAEDDVDEEHYQGPKQEGAST